MSDQNKRPSSRQEKQKVSTRGNISFEEPESGYGTAPDTAENQTTPSRPDSISTITPRSSCKHIVYIDSVLCCRVILNVMSVAFCFKFCCSFMRVLCLYVCASTYNYVWGVHLTDKVFCVCTHAFGELIIHNLMYLCRLKTVMF